MNLTKIFKRAIDDGIEGKQDGPMPIRTLALMTLTKSEYKFLFKLETSLVDEKIYTLSKKSQERRVWMVNMFKLTEYPESSWIQFFS